MSQQVIAFNRSPSRARNDGLGSCIKKAGKSLPFRGCAMKRGRAVHVNEDDERDYDDGVCLY